MKKCIHEKRSLEDLSLEEMRAESELFDTDVYQAIALMTCVSRRSLRGGARTRSRDKKHCSGRTVAGPIQGGDKAMRTWEDRFKSWIQRNVLWLAFAIVFLFGAFMRYTLISVIVPDMQADYIPWMEALQSGGIRNLLTEFHPFPYSAMHVNLWALVAAVFPHANALVLLKGVVIFFDMAQIAVGCLLVWELLPDEKKQTGLFTAFALLCLNPILLLNAAAWGTDGCDLSGVFPADAAAAVP